MFITFKGEWKFSYFDNTNPSAFNNDMLLFSTVLSVASIISGTVKGIRSIQSIRKRLNKERNQPDIPLEEVKFSMIGERTESSELPPENLNVTKKQLVAFAYVKETGEIYNLITIFPDGKVLKITPDENSKICFSSNEEVSYQNLTDTIE